MTFTQSDGDLQVIDAPTVMLQNVQCLVIHKFSRGFQ